ncbi:hypothetical protein BKA81DRAFT_8772 [Phyllosticta paracitricarpa]
MEGSAGGVVWWRRMVGWRVVLGCLGAWVLGRPGSGPARGRQRAASRPRVYPAAAKRERKQKGDNQRQRLDSTRLDSTRLDRTDNSVNSATHHRKSLVQALPIRLSPLLLPYRTAPHRTAPSRRPCPCPWP